MTAVAEWLAGIGLPQYADLFEANDIDLQLLPHLTEAHLEQLGVRSLGHRLRIREAAARQDTVKAHPPEGAKQPKPEPAPYAERRQLTVLFCDLAGSTQLSQQLDPESLRTLLDGYQRACRAVIECYDGHVAQYLGDGIMAYFGWPRAHEDDAERALRAGLELIRAVKSVAAPSPLQVRIGVASGPVVVGEAGADPSSPRLAVGETPNVAARLQGLAGLDEVVVAPSTRQLAGGVFRYADLGAQMLKGIVQPVNAWRVEALSEAQGRFEARGAQLTALVGREEEVEQLRKRWRQAQAGEGQVVLINGEPGIGKSRLTQVLTELVSTEAHIRLRYQCSPYHTNSAFYPIIDHMMRVAELCDDDAPEAKLSKLQAALSRANSDYPHATQLIAALLGIPGEYTRLNYSPQKQKDETIKALSAQMRGLARQTPVLVILEDIHWIDPSSLEAFDQLIHMVPALRVLLLATYRPEFAPKWHGQSHVTALTLSRLTNKQAADLVKQVASAHPLPEAVIEQISAKTDGIPLFVEELTKVVLERGPRSDLQIPATLKDSLMARLDGLGAAKEIAQVGACIGREFGFGLLCSVAADNDEAVGSTLKQLTAAELLFERGTPPDSTYTFKHALIQDAAYDSLLKTRRQQLHARIAQVLEVEFPEITRKVPEVLAHHLTQAGMREEAVPHWIEAGNRALSRTAALEAVGHLQAALRLNEDLPRSRPREEQQLAIRQLLATAHLFRAGWSAIEIAETLRPARDLAMGLGLTKELVRVLMWLWLSDAMRLEYRSALPMVEQLEAVAARTGDPETVLVAGTSSTIISVWMGDFQRAAQSLRATRDIYQQEEEHADLIHQYGYDPQCGAMIWGGYGLWALGYPDQARRLTEEQLVHARRIGHAFNLAWVLSLSTMNLVYCGEVERPRRWLDEASAIARDQVIVPMIEVEHPYHRGLALVVEGQSQAGLEMLTGAVSAWRAVGWPHPIPRAHLHQAVALNALGRTEEAKSLMRDAFTMIRSSGHGMDEAEAHRVMGTLLLSGARPDEAAAEAEFLHALEVARAQHARSLELRAAMSLARLYQGRGKVMEARAVLRPVYEWFTEGFDTKDLIEAKGLLEELARGA